MPTPTPPPDPRDPATMMHALMALQEAVPYLGWDFERSEMDDYVDHRRIRVTIALTDEQGEFLRQGREMFRPIGG